MRQFDNVQRWFQGRPKPSDSMEDTTAINSADPALSSFSPFSKRPSAKRLAKSRKFLVPLIWFLALTVLILSYSYAYCSLKPHSDSSVDSATDSSGTAPSYPSDGSMWAGAYVRRDDIPYTLSNPSSAPDEATSDVQGTDGANSTGQAPVPPTTGSANSTDDSIALSFYTFTLPASQLIACAAELAPTFVGPVLLTNRNVYNSLMGLTAMMLTGWIIQVAFWIHCEIVSQSSSLSPQSLRDHDLNMATMKQLSIGKITLTWLIICGLAVHLALQVLDYRKSRRTWTVEKGGNEFTYDAKTDRVSIEEHEYGHQVRQAI